MDLTNQTLTYSKKGKDIGTRCYPHAHNCTKPEEEDTHSIRKKFIGIQYTDHENVDKRWLAQNGKVRNKKFPAHILFQ